VEGSASGVVFAYERVGLEASLDRYGLGNDGVYMGGEFLEHIVMRTYEHAGLGVLRKGS
jgi:hypothetical protein